ncbi:hypothetical protein SAMN04488689_10375 [Paenibacillus sp. cl6col]|uniref:hypothetical protein n=1 Tax=Paenibacillus sp. cl6col TaxID=1761878 RepID=UPI0008906532|nr:hypothetical protein [Paenibacillus sp. cl6col]SDE94366.1 hypothetical protein SAMN04488689_10375 [Paenibacillus sp. cl6col]
MNQVVVTRAAQAEKKRIQQLIQFYIYDFTEYTGAPFKKMVRIVRCQTSISIGLIP